MMAKMAKLSKAQELAVAWFVRNRHLGLIAQPYGRPNTLAVLERDGYITHETQGARSGWRATYKAVEWITVRDAAAAPVVEETVTEGVRDEEASLLARIEARQADFSHDGDGLFAYDHDYSALVSLWNAGRIVPGSRTSGGGGKLGWYSVRMIDADHAEALAMDAYRTAGAYCPVTVAAPGTSCGWVAYGETGRRLTCQGGKPAVHVLTKSLPVAKAGTALCGFHSPFDTTPEERALVAVMEETASPTVCDETVTPSTRWRAPHGKRKGRR